MVENKYQIGVRRFGLINWIGFCSLYVKEVSRFLIVWAQTLLSPLVSSLLFLSVLTLALGNGRGDVCRSARRRGVGGSPRQSRLKYRLRSADPGTHAADPYNLGPRSRKRTDAIGSTRGSSRRFGLRHSHTACNLVQAAGRLLPKIETRSP